MRARNEQHLTCDLSRPEFDMIVAAASQGGAQALQELRSILDDNPALWKSIANLGGHCELLLINLVSGHSLLMGESLQRQVDEYKSALTDESAGPLHEMAVQRVINAWLLMSYVDGVCLAPETKAEIQRMEAAHRQFDLAVKSLRAVARHATKDLVPKPLRVVG
jgi:hypothetical protein